MPEFDYQFDQRIKNGFAAMGLVHISVEVRSTTLIAGELFYVECVLYPYASRVRCLVMDTGAEAIIFLDARMAHEIFTRPALEKYTVEHPWILGV